jgi:hypothetical protein
VHVAEIVVGISGGDVDVDVADGMRAVNDGDDVVGAEEASEGGDGQDDGGVGGYVADNAAADVEGGGVGLEEGSQGFDERCVAAQGPLRGKAEEKGEGEGEGEGGWGGQQLLACTGTVTTFTPRRDVSQV